MIYSENDVTNEQDTPIDPIELLAGVAGDANVDLTAPSPSGDKMADDKLSEEGSLHDSMEILEEVATEDHFDMVEGSEDEDERDIFEMPPMASVVRSLEASPAPAEPTPVQAPNNPDLQVTVKNIEISDATPHPEQPELVDAQQAIHRLREHTHSPQCRPPPPESNLEDEVIL